MSPLSKTKRTYGQNEGVLLLIAVVQNKKK